MQFLLSIYKIDFFCLALSTICQNNLTKSSSINPFGRKVAEVEERKGKKNAVNSGHLVLQKRTQPARAKIVIATLCIKMWNSPVLNKFTSFSVILGTNMNPFLDRHWS